MSLGKLVALKGTKKVPEEVFDLSCKSSPLYALLVRVF